MGFFPMMCFNMLSLSSRKGGLMGLNLGRGSKSRGVAQINVGVAQKMARRLTRVGRGFGGGRRLLSASVGGESAPEAFAKSKTGAFSQSPPALCNPFTGDPLLQAYLARVLPAEARESMFVDLETFGNRVCNEIDHLGRQAELEPPYLRKFNGWGKRTDELVTSSAWRQLHRISAEEGLISIAYNRQHAQWSRLHQMAKLYLFGSSSGLYSCPLAMTDGAAKLIEEVDDAYLRERALSRLTSRDPAHFWTSGQWMTEKKGGSDVASGTDTYAQPRGKGKGSEYNVGGSEHDDDAGSYSLHGYKWFTSALDANMAFTLARVVDQEGKATKGTKGLSLFYLETKDEKGCFNGIEVQCLKNKLGTRQLPTAELLLDGTKARLVGEEGKGVSGISHMLTITRIHNSLMAVSGMRRILQLSRDYSTRRVAFGKLLSHHPLHMQTLSRMEVETRGSVLFVLELCRLLGLHDCAMASHTQQDLLRLMTSVAKLYTAKQAVSVISEGVESFGGQGYIEDTGIPTLLRDAQVLPIWEGTTNILSLDVLRVLYKTKGEALQSLVDTINTKLSSVTRQLEQRGLVELITPLKHKLDTVVSFARQATGEDPAIMELAARDFSFSLAQVFIGALLIEHAALCNEETFHLERAVAQRSCLMPLPLLTMDHYAPHTHHTNTLLVMQSGGPSHL